ncbi:hypothetical protein POM88_028539 [Heracleum sosnowskyi]|uniref:Uncharacterized protein n=1 Tax=Heracleum sosnowskyi TaxID=360622 RepID=A0AAD8MGE1_9APIA|nr:hypothetical protein POM88_028539 [Heracleum sosnowskyi]
MLRCAKQITLYLRFDDNYEYTEPTKIQNLVKNYSQSISFPIYTWQEKSRTVEVEEKEEPKEGEKAKLEEEKKKIKKTKTEKSFNSMPTHSFTKASERCRFIRVDFNVKDLSANVTSTTQCFVDRSNASASEPNKLFGNHQSNSGEGSSSGAQNLLSAFNDVDDDEDVHNDNVNDILNPENQVYEAVVSDEEVDDDVAHRGHYVVDDEFDKENEIPGIEVLKSYDNSH